MAIWNVSDARLLYTRDFGVTQLEDLCFKFGYSQPSVGFCLVPKRTWCSNLGRFAAHFTLKGYDTSPKNHFGVITSFTCYGSTIAEAVSKLVKEAVLFITFRASELQRYG
nr:nonstructural protein NS4 [Betacoronavirus sp.]